MNTRVIAIACLLALLVVGSAWAQPQPDEQEWGLAEAAAGCGNWETAIGYWTAFLDRPGWPYPEARGAVTLRLAAAFRRCARYADARQRLAPLIADARRDNRYALPALVELAAVDMAESPTSDTRLRVLARALDDETRPAGFLGDYVAGLADQGNLAAWATAMRQYEASLRNDRRRVAVRLAHIRLLKAGGDSAAAQVLAEATLPTVRGTADEVAVALVLADLAAQRGDPATACSVLNALPPARLGGVRKQLAAHDAAAQQAAADQAAIAARVSDLLANPLASGDLSSLVDPARRTPAAATWAAQALDAHLAAHPWCRRAPQAMRARIDLLMAAGDWRAARSAADGLALAVAGSALEVDVALVRHDIASRLGDSATERAAVLDLAAFYPSHTVLQARALAIACEAHDGMQVAVVGRRLLARGAITAPMMGLLFDAMTWALTNECLIDAVALSRLLNDIAPEHALSVKARLLLRT